MLKTTACVLALFASLPAAAGEPLTPQRELVRYDDLNLASPTGIARLERRLDAAVRRVCGYYAVQAMSRITPTDVSACMTKARAAASEEVALKTGATIRKG